ncbi:cytochrome c oxidase assembly factor 8 isoform X1 [Syngnathoides biaculeatus]|uniref:cytochrome c oxidase assembly factor 8 isoform X1 n=1 Tax=Syngnathoides biaculeatus TaxID=300417 RepID=UPI002ADE6DE9|nr:cytochrome c oxidase assembly factor 8 isoform X1 [Syngnathoides biaculeatus]
MSVGTFAGCWTRHRWTCLRTRHNVVTAAASRRQCSELATKQQDKSPKRSKSRPAPSATRDWIGPPDPLSNLRPVVYRAAPRESELEGRLRNLRQDTEDWNHAFWTQQNVTFSEEKNAFVASQLRAKGLTERDQQGCRRRRRRRLQHTRSRRSENSNSTAKGDIHDRPESFSTKRANPHVLVGLRVVRFKSRNGRRSGGISISPCRHKGFSSEPVWTPLQTGTAAHVGVGGLVERPRRTAGTETQACTTLTSCQSLLENKDGRARRCRAGFCARGRCGRRRTLSTEEMSVFYKNFLDKNRERHARYNKEWYRRNLSVTVLMARVALHKLWKTLVDKRRRNTPAT